MNNQSEQFIRRLFAEVWSPLDSSKLEQFYHGGLLATVGTQVATYDDVVNRMQYCQQRFTHLENDIEDIISANDKVTVRIKQTAFPKDRTKKNIVSQVMAVYQLKHEKISHVWMDVTPAVNYFEKI